MLDTTHSALSFVKTFLYRHVLVIACLFMLLPLSALLVAKDINHVSHPLLQAGGEMTLAPSGSDGGGPWP